MSQRKSLGLVALVAIPSLFFGLIFSMILLLAPAKPAAADCGPVSVVSRRQHEGRRVHRGAVEERRSHHGRRQSIEPVGQRADDQRHGGPGGVRAAGPGYGDGAGPDSRGLFQQRDNGAWGSYADRMDPTISATNFIKALQAVAGWELLEPTIAGNKVQRNADPYHYQKYWPEAVKLVQALSDAKFSLAGQRLRHPRTIRCRG